MFHFAAYTGSVGQTANTALTAVTDQVMAIQNSHLIPQSDMELMAAYAASTTINRARIRTPYMVSVAPKQIRPVHRATSGPTDPNFDNLTFDTFKLRGMEEIVVEATSDLGMGNETVRVGLWLGDGITPAPVGDLFCIRATGTATLVADTWTTVPLTFDDILGAGLYAIVGAEAVSATGVFFRLLLNNQLWRPGGLAVASVASRGPDIQRYETLGLWGQFRSTALPNMEMLATAGDTAETLFLWIKKISDF